MILLKVVHFPETNSVEATWIDADGKQVRSHSYADVQMAELESDLGADAANYAALIAEVRAGIRPPEPEPVVVPDSVAMWQAEILLRRLGLFADVELFVSEQGAEALVKWNRSTVIERTNALVLAWAAARGKTDQDLDALFVAASQII